MAFSASQILWMVPVGILAGIISSTVGMASLVSYPALLYIGGLASQPVFANVTNTAAMIFSGLGSGLSSIPELRGHVKQVITTLLLTFFGSIGGTVLLLLEPSSSFQKIVPFFILMAGIMILWPRKNHAADPDRQHHVKLKFKIMAAVAILIMGGYMGYFGAAAGVIMIAILSWTTNESYPVYNAVKNVSALSANVVAMIIYAIKSHVYWIMVIPLGIGLFIGGYIGPKIVRHVSEKTLKMIVGIAALCLSIYMFIQAY